MTFLFSICIMLYVFSSHHPHFSMYVSYMCVLITAVPHESLKCCVNVCLQGWSFDIEKNDVFFPGEDGFSHSQYFLGACFSLSRVGALWSIPNNFGISLVLYFCFGHVKAFILVRVYGCFPDITRNYNLTENTMILWLLQSFCSNFCSVPWALGVEVFCGCIWICWLLVFTNRVCNVVMILKKSCLHFFEQ